MSVSHIGLCALAPLPGTVLVGQQSDGVIRQYSASTGALVGSLQVFQPDGESSTTVRSMAYVNGQLLATASSLTSVHFGPIDVVTGTLSSTPLSLGFNPTRIGTRGTELLQIGSNNVFIYDSTLTFTDYIMLSPPAGSDFFSGEFTSIAWDGIGNAFVTSNSMTGEYNRVAYWRSDGTLQGQRNINPVVDYYIASIDMNANNNDLYVAYDANFSNVGYLRKYAFGSAVPLWSVPIPKSGPIQDIVYIPIPTPISIVTIFAGMTILSRRRR